MIGKSSWTPTTLRRDSCAAARSPSIMGVEHLLASYPPGACGSFSSSGAIAPNLCNKFFAALEAHDWKTARECQFRISRLWNLFKEQYPSSLKGAM